MTLQEGLEIFSNMDKIKYYWEIAEMCWQQHLLITSKLHTTYREVLKDKERKETSIVGNETAFLELIDRQELEAAMHYEKVLFHIELYTNEAQAALDIKEQFLTKFNELKKKKVPGNVGRQACLELISIRHNIDEEGWDIINGGGNVLSGKRPRDEPLRPW